MTDTPTPPRVTRKHLTRLREIYRSSGWPCRDPLEVDLIVGGLVQPERDDQGRETLHLTRAGLQALADAHATNRANRSAHDELVMQVAQRMQQEGRIAWTQLALRAQVEGAWTQAIPDVFSIRHPTVEAYLEPVVHESRSAGQICWVTSNDRRSYLSGNDLTGLLRARRQCQGAADCGS